MEPGQDRDEYFLEKTLGRSELEKMGEPVSYRRFKDTSAAGYNNIELVMYRDPTVNIDEMQSTLRHLYLDELARNDGEKGAVAGGGIAMTGETPTCHACGNQGYYTRNFPKNKNKAAS